MTDKELLEKLKIMKELKPDSKWKTSNRELLFSQISASVAPEKENTFTLKFKNVFKVMAQPSVVAFLVVLTISGGFGFRSVVKSRPGDSLYIAKVISEKAQLAITFNKNKKDKLETKFASQRAKQITKMLATPDYTPEEDKDDREKLVLSFKKEISFVKDKVKEMNTEEKDNDVEGVEDSEESMVFSAGLKKEKDGIKISSSDSSNDLEDTKDVATSTLEILEKEENVEEILEEAEQLFEDKDYQGTLEKLEKVEAIISKEGEIKGVTEEATSTVEEAVIE